MNCLILEDNKTISNIIKAGLSAYGYNMTCKPLHKDSLEEIKDRPYSFVFLNIGRQRISQEYTKMIRELHALVSKIRDYNKNVLVMGILPKDNYPLKVDFLNLGGDDVLTYPFSLKELLARIQALLRRPLQATNSTLYLSDVSINTGEHRVYKKDKEIPLRRKEYNILEYLARNKNRPISRSELLDHVWDYKRIVGSNTVDVHINKLRKTLRDRSLIETVHGFGYKATDAKRKAIIKPKPLV